MSVFTKLLFTHDYLPEADAVEADFGPTYGNRVAAERATRERWERERDLAEILIADGASASNVETSAVRRCA